MLPITRVWTLLEFPVNQNQIISNSGLFGKKDTTNGHFFKMNLSNFYDICNNHICAIIDVLVNMCFKNNIAFKNDGHDGNSVF